MSAARVLGVGYGAPAIAALRAVLAELKRDDPLTPVTVLVPNNIAGIVARRALATGVAPGRPGIAGVHLTTLSRLAEQLAVPMMSPRTPATRAAVSAAWRAELQGDAGPFARVRDHPATIRALTAAGRELGELTDDELRTVEAAGHVQRELIKLHRRVTDRIRERSYDAVELLTAAAWAVAEDPAAVTGAVVLYLPQRLSPSEVALARAVADRADCTVILGLTGEPRADASVRASIEAVTGHPGPPGPTAPIARQVRHHSDSDDEVRGVVHGVLDTLHHTPAHRIAVLYATALPYARLLHEQLAAAGVLGNGPGVAAVDERALARGLLAILSLPADLPRADLFRALSHAPVRNPVSGQPVPVAGWERVSRMAGMVRGADWDGRLRRFADVQLARVANSTVESGERVGFDGRERDAEAALALSAFAAELGRQLSAGAALRSWPEIARWATELFHDLYGDTADLADLPPAERYGATLVEQVLPSLASLGDLESRSDVALLVEVLAEELRSARHRVGRFGEGVFVGPISAAVGLSADSVFVLGLSEDAYPGATHVEALLPDRIRDAVPGLPGSRERLATEHRELLAALMSADRVVASFARGDLRRNTQRLPSRWLLPTLRALGGDQRLAATQWAQATSPQITGAPSYAATLGRSQRPATDQEWRVRSVSTGGPPDALTAAAIDVLTARAGTALTRFDGNLSAATDLPDPGSVLQSATRLESYAVCPHAYFVQRLLRVEPVEQPEQTIVISALDIGSLMHEAMDEFVTSEHDRLPGYGQPWTDDQRERLLAIGAAKAAEFETRGLTGHPLLWAAERTRILADLVTMLDDDNQWRASLDARVVASELTFGRDDTPPVTLHLPSGRIIRLRGSADKVDQARDGTVLVTDLKTGGPDRFAVLAKDPIAAGTKLQLPLYAYAARQQLGEHPVLAQYWFVRKGRRRDGPARIGVRLDADVQATYLAALDVLMDGIATGLFPARAPEAPDFAWVLCPYCNPDSLGHQAVRDRWERMRGDPLLRRYVTLVEPAGAS